MRSEHGVKLFILKGLVRPERFELPTPCFVGKQNWSNSVILRHGW
jgi:hypothetical protein